MTTGGLVAGGIAGFLTVAAGGSIGQAPHALVVLFGCVGAVTLCGSAVAGARADGLGTLLAAASCLTGSYAATLVYSKDHSASGDAIIVIIASVSAAIGAPLGYFLGTNFIPRSGDFSRANNRPYTRRSRGHTRPRQSVTPAGGRGQRTQLPIPYGEPSQRPENAGQGRT